MIFVFIKKEFSLRVFFTLLFYKSNKKFMFIIKIKIYNQEINGKSNPKSTPY